MGVPPLRCYHKGKTGKGTTHKFYQMEKSLQNSNKKSALNRPVSKAQRGLLFLSVMD